MFRGNLCEYDAPIKTVVANLVGLPLFLRNQHAAWRTNFEYKYYIQIFTRVIHRTIRNIYCITFILFQTFHVLAINILIQINFGLGHPLEDTERHMEEEVRSAFSINLLRTNVGYNPLRLRVY